MRIKIIGAQAIVAAAIASSILVNSPNSFCWSSPIESGQAIPVASPSPTPIDVPHFNTLPSTGVFAEGGGGYTSAQCAAALDPNASSDMYNGHPINVETVPENQQPHSPGSPADGITTPVNQTKPNADQLAYYASDGYRSSEMDAPYTWMKLVDGQYTGQQR
jgi:hypothetical protein